MEEGTYNWIGASGREYIYHIHSLPVNFNLNQPGNYIYAKANYSYEWIPVYIGQGDLGERISENHHQAECIRAKGATHVHVHLNASEANRVSEEKDLLENYTNAYKPNGCNEA